MSVPFEERAIACQWQTNACNVGPFAHKFYAKVAFARPAHPGRNFSATSRLQSPPSRGLLAFSQPFTLQENIVDPIECLHPRSVVMRALAVRSPCTFREMLRKGLVPPPDVPSIGGAGAKWLGSSIREAQRRVIEDAQHRAEIAAA